MNKEERLERARSTDGEDSAFVVLRGDSNRVALIELFNGDGIQGETYLDQLAYQSLVSGLRLAIDVLEEKIKAKRSAPGGLSIYADRIKKFKAQRDELVEVLVRFDF